jgi:hypothetical protein
VRDTRRHCLGPGRSRDGDAGGAAKAGPASGAARTLHFARGRASAMPTSNGTGEQPVLRSRTRFHPDASARVPVRDAPARDDERGYRSTLRLLDEGNGGGGVRRAWQAVLFAAKRAAPGWGGTWRRLHVQRARPRAVGCRRAAASQRWRHAPGAGCAVTPRVRRRSTGLPQPYMATVTPLRGTKPPQLAFARGNLGGTG